MKLLVHACCGPCAIMPTRLLTQEGHDITVFYSNSNIAPEEEYLHRLAELRRFGAQEGFSVIEDAYDPESWEARVAPLGERLAAHSPALAARGAEGEPERFASVGSVAELLDDERRRERCRACYRMRLEAAAAFACKEGFEGVATTLAVSPYQFGDIMEEELERACEGTGLVPCFDDFRPHYDEAVAISRELGMYRQNYCGCRFSVAEGAATREFLKAQRKARKAAKERSRAEAEEERTRAKAQKQAYAAKQARKKEILKALRQGEKPDPAVF